VAGEKGTRIARISRIQSVRLIIFYRHADLADLADNHWQANDKNLLNPLNLHAQLQTGFTELEVMQILQWGGVKFFVGRPLGEKSNKI
jgi:hypothetical protein